MKPANSERIEKLSPRKIRQKQLAIAVMEPGVTYREVGEKLYPQAVKQPGQTVYRCLQSPTAQAELARLHAETKELYSAEQALADLDIFQKMAERKKIPVAGVTAVMGKAKIAGLLVDQVRDVTETHSQIKVESESDKILSELSVDTNGIKAVSESGQAEIVQPGSTSDEPGAENDPTPSGKGMDGTEEQVPR